MIKNRLVLIDAFALIHRAYHGIPPLTNKDGVLVNAVYGFTSAILTTIKDLEPEYLVVGIDLPKPTRRKLEYDQYKAHRIPLKDDFKAQIPYVMELLKIFNIPIVSAEGYEGEDVIATIIKLTANRQPPTANQMEYIIVTGDMDTLQLVNHETKVYSMARGTTRAVMYTEAKVVEKYGFKPSQIVDYKALRGDPSDNIPGVRGIGEKGAADLIKKNGNLKFIYQNIEKILPKYQTLLKEQKEQAFLSQKLSKIVTDAPVSFELKESRIHDYNENKVRDFLTKMGFRSLLARLPEAHRSVQQDTLL